MRKMIMDDGFQSYLTEGATFVGEPGIPCLLDLKNVEIPNSLVSFAKCLSTKNKRQYVHFYIHDIQFGRVLISTKRYLELLRSFDGVISPDPTILIGQSKCLQETNTYFNRAIGFFLQKNGIPVIPNVRWGDESTYSFCFLGIPKGSTVSISTHGCLAKDLKTNNIVRESFKKGLPVMLNTIQPKAVIVYGYMPNDIFGSLNTSIPFYRFPSEFEQTHKGGPEDGNGL